ncbi:hypothetical protein Ancab_004850 [Ancistrocladus abbreviatus]
MGRNSLLFLSSTVVIVFGIASRDVESNLANDYYKSSCPNVEEIVKNEMLALLTTDVTASAAFLRLFFHDCQVQGCDASILLDSKDSEMMSLRNFGIRKREEIGHIKSILEGVCPGIVSCADIIALAAREAVAYAGGPHIQIPLGRKDSTTSSYEQADAHLPSPRISVDQMLRIFTTKGMSLEESIAILGAHTLGVGHCINIVDRLYDPDPTDTMDFGFELALKFKCPTRTPLTNLTFMPNDITPTIFDTQYYRDISSGKGLFGIDSSISKDPRTASVVARFTNDQTYFFQTFSSAFIKLSAVNVLNESTGQVRLKCNRVN